MPTSGTISATIAPATSGYATKFEALAVGWHLILIAIPIAILLSVFVMVVVRLTAACFIYLLIFLLIGTLLTLGIYVWTQPVGASAGVTSMFNSQFTRAVFSIVCFILAGATLLFVCCYHSRISLAAKITEVSAIFVAKNCLITLLPLVMFIVTLVWLVVWML